MTFGPGQPVHVAGCHAPPLTDTSIPDTATLSVAEPLIVYGSGEALLRAAPFAGLIMVEDGAPASAVVYENG